MTRNASFGAPALAILLTLSGCAGPAPKDDDTPRAGAERAAGPQPDTAQELLARARGRDSPQAEALILDAVDKMLANNRLAQAEQWLAKLTLRKLPQALAARAVASRGLLALHRQQPEQALKTLRRFRQRQAEAGERLPAAQRLALSRVQASALELKGEYLAAARERIFMDPLFEKPEARTANHRAIWHDLMFIASDELGARAAQNGPRDYRGWLQLAFLNKAYQDDLDRQLAELRKWLEAHPQHPASKALPGSLQRLAQAAQKRPQHVAVLLPQKGSYAGAAEAVRNGLMAAHYRALGQQRPAPILSVYDTAGGRSLEAIYQELTERGVDMVVGPLTKAKVKKLATKDELALPTLALNFRDAGPPNAAHHEPAKRLYQFGLAAEDEARQVAKRAYQAGHRNAATLYPDTAWGERIHRAFRQAWDEREATQLVSAAAYPDERQGNRQAIRRMLNLDASRERAIAIEQTLGEDIQFQPRRRQDIDYIFMLARAQNARRLNPMLDFQHASALPVYATSHVYEGSPNAQRDKDISGVRFCEIPWNLKSDLALKQKTTEVWPQATGRQGRLYALGVDAYQLIPRLQLMAAAPRSRYFGVTGHLSLTPARRIRRELVWAKIRNGRPQRLPAKVGTGERAGEAGAEAQLGRE